MTEIIAVQGLMVAGDRGIEIPTEGVHRPEGDDRRVQQGEAVICATQDAGVLGEEAPPTRAEASDVANAILDGADCVMSAGRTGQKGRLSRGLCQDHGQDL